MFYSKLLGKTRREVPKDEASLNAKLLIQAGFIHKEMAGVYTYLPMGLLVINKIAGVIREEMGAIGGQEIALTALQEKALWEKTNRWDDGAVDAWFKTRLKSGTELGLGLTHEEPLTRIVAKYVQSYKDLPLYVYQIQNKFRNELRSKSGLLRGREFLMKDLYSFDKTEAELDEFYDKCARAYTNIFNRLGIGESTFMTFASGGIFAKYSHEFQTLCADGEDTIYVDKEKKIAINKEVYTKEVAADLGLKEEDLTEERSVEVGNIFKLGTRFSEALGLTYADEADQRRFAVMGSYGIGLGRAMGTVVEVLHDDAGIIWPESISPFDIHLIGLNLDDKGVRDTAFKSYEQLIQAGKSVLFDDRLETSPGEKLSDAGLIGIPIRALVSTRTNGKIEVKKRNEKIPELIDVEELCTRS